MHCNYVIHNNNSWVLKKCTSSQLLTSFILWHTSSTYAMTHLDSKTSVYPQSPIITPLFLWLSWFLQWCFPCGIYNTEFNKHSFLLIAAILYNCRAWPRVETTTPECFNSLKLYDSEFHDSLEKLEYFYLWGQNHGMYCVQLSVSYLLVTLDSKYFHA